jgi:hypothetical protein
MNIHALFPTLLLEEVNPNHDAHKEMFMKQIFKHLDADGYSDESTGHVTLHHDLIYTPILEMATHMAQQYCSVMQIDHDLFDFNIVKTWFNIIQDRSTPYHNHADAHLSFVYYINVPTDHAQSIQFYSDRDRHEPYAGFVKFNNPAEWNIFNSIAWQFPSSEGTMFLWPAKMCHDTIGKGSDLDPGLKVLDDAKNNRISLAGDIILTFKEKSNKPMGLQPRRNWRTFNGKTG